MKDNFTSIAQASKKTEILAFILLHLCLLAPLFFKDYVDDTDESFCIFVITCALYIGIVFSLYFINTIDKNGINCIGDVMRL